MRLDAVVVQQVVSEVILELIVDGDLQVSPLRVDAVEREVAIAMRESLLREDALRRLDRPGREVGNPGFDAGARRGGTAAEAAPGSGRGMLAVVEAMIAVLRRSPNVEQVNPDGDALLWKILSVIARPSRPRKGSTPSGGACSPPVGGGAPGGCPAEARVSDRPPRPRPPADDPDRRGRQTRRS